MVKFIFFFFMFGISTFMVLLYLYQHKFVIYIKKQYPNSWPKILKQEALPFVKPFQGAKRTVVIKTIFDDINASHLISLNDPKLLILYLNLKYLMISFMIFVVIASLSIIISATIIIKSNPRHSFIAIGVGTIGIIMIFQVILTIYEYVRKKEKGA